MARAPHELWVRVSLQAATGPHTDAVSVSETRLCMCVGPRRLSCLGPRWLLRRGQDQLPEARRLSSTQVREMPRVSLGPASGHRAGRRASAASPPTGVSLC